VNRERHGLLWVVCLLTIGSLVAGSCTLPSSLKVTLDPGGNITVSLEEPGAGETAVPEEVPTGAPFELGEIASERELTADEFFQAAEGDETFDDVYALATEEGYTEPRGGGEYTLTDGSTIRGLLLTSADERMVVAFHFQLQDRSQSLVARVEDERETVVLYNRDGRAEISPQGVTIFDAVGNPLGEGVSYWNGRTPGLARPKLQCDDGNPNAFSWEDFDHCGRTHSGSAWSQITGCIAAYAGAVVGVSFASAAAAPFVFVGGLVAIFVGCRVPTICIWDARVDDPPTYDIRMPTKMSQPCGTECVAHGDRMARLNINNYEIQVHVDDDRKPRPASPQVVQVCANDTKTLRIRDCAGHQIDVQVSAPCSTDQDIRDDCGLEETCVQEGNEARCVRAETPVVPPQATEEAQPPAVEGGGSVEVSLSWEGVEADLDLFVTEPSGETLSNANLSSASGGRFTAWECCDTWDALCTMAPPGESAVWEQGTAPSGEYRVQVGFAKGCDTDVLSAEWTVTVRVDGEVEEHYGRISYGERKEVLTFTR
jgi:hypothetical protein